MSSEGMPNNQESNEQFNQFEKRVKETSVVYTDAVEHYKSRSKFPESFDKFNDEIKGEATSCIILAKDQYDLFDKEIAANLDTFKKEIGPHFDMPSKAMDSAMKQSEIMLDFRPFDVMEQKITEIEKHLQAIKETHPELSEKLDDFKSTIEVSITDVYNSTMQIARNLRQHVSDQMREQAMASAHKINDLTSESEKISSKLETEYGGRFHQLIDTFIFNCSGIVEKAKKQFEEEWPGIN